MVPVLCQKLSKETFLAHQGTYGVSPWTDTSLGGRRTWPIVGTGERFGESLGRENSPIRLEAPDPFNQCGESNNDGRGESNEIPKHVVTCDLLGTNEAR